MYYQYNHQRNDHLRPALLYCISHDTHRHARLIFDENNDQNTNFYKHKGNKYWKYSVRLTFYVKWPILIRIQSWTITFEAPEIRPLISPTNSEPCYKSRLKNGLFITRAGFMSPDFRALTGLHCIRYWMVYNWRENTIWMSGFIAGVLFCEK